MLTKEDLKDSGWEGGLEDLRYKQAHEVGRFSKDNYFLTLFVDGRILIQYADLTKDDLCCNIGWGHLYLGKCRNSHELLKIMDLIKV